MYFSLIILDYFVSAHTIDPPTVHLPNSLYHCRFYPTTTHTLVALVQPKMPSAPANTADVMTFDDKELDIE